MSTPLSQLVITKSRIDLYIESTTSDLEVIQHTPCSETVSVSFLSLPCHARSLLVCGVRQTTPSSSPAHPPGTILSSSSLEHTTPEHAPCLTVSAPSHQLCSHQLSPHPTLPTSESAVTKSITNEDAGAVEWSDLSHAMHSRSISPISPVKSWTNQKRLLELSRVATGSHEHP